MLINFYKRKADNRIWWTKDIKHRGQMLFSFDRVNVFSVYIDYPDKLTPEQKEIFDKENPYWAKVRGSK